MADTRSLEREETLEIIDTEQAETIDEDVVHISCCNWRMWVALQKDHYALCGVKLTGQADVEAEITCPVCLELDKSTASHTCPMAIFARSI